MLSIASRYRIRISSVKDCFRPFQCVALWLGFVSLTHPKDSPVSSSISWFSLVALLLNSVGSLIGLLFSFIELSDSDGLPLHRGYTWCYVCFVVAQLIGNQVTLNRRHRIADFLQNLQCIDEQLFELGSSAIDYWTPYLVTVSGCVYTVLTTFSLGVLYLGSSLSVCVLSPWELANQSVAYVYATLAYLANLGAVVLGLLSVRQRLYVLNEHFGTMDPRTTDARTVQHAARIYELLTDVGDMHMANFTVSVIGCLAAALLTNIIAMFGVHAMIVQLQMNELPVWPLIVTTVLWNGHTQAYMLLLAYAGDTLAAAGRRTGQIIHRQLNECRSYESLCVQSNWGAVERQLEHFSGQVLHRHPQAHCRLFALDWTILSAVSKDKISIFTDLCSIYTFSILLSQMMATSFLYLVIMLQLNTNDVILDQNANVSILIC